MISTDFYWVWGFLEHDGFPVDHLPKPTPKPFRKGGATGRAAVRKRGPDVCLGAQKTRGKPRMFFPCAKPKVCICWDELADSIYFHCHHVIAYCLDCQMLLCHLFGSNCGSWDFFYLQFQYVAEDKIQMVREKIGIHNSKINATQQPHHCLSLFFEKNIVKIETP